VCRKESKRPVLLTAIARCQNTRRHALLDLNEPSVGNEHPLLEAFVSVTPFILTRRICFKKGRIAVSKLSTESFNPAD